LYYNKKLELYRNRKLKIESNPDETLADFKIKIQEILKKRYEDEIEKLKEKYEEKEQKLEKRLRRAEDKLEKEQDDVTARTTDTILGFGMTLLDAFLGRKTIKRSTATRAAGSLRSAGRVFKEKEDVKRAEEEVKSIEEELKERLEYFRKEGKYVEAQRLEQRTRYDIEMIKEIGYCAGIENYSRHMDGRPPGSRPACLFDYFPEDYLLIIDESHVTVPQIRGMYNGDRARKETLVEYGFRLPSALDNRPLKFEEFESLVNQVIYVSATPGDYELQKSGGAVVEQIIRPTGLLDPEIEVRPVANQIDDLLEEIRKRVKKKERVLVTTLTKKMAEDLTDYLEKLDIKVRYIHSDIDALERVEIIRDLRIGDFDVLVGVNLLREGLDLPEVSLVAIIDADKEGFLRSERSLMQTAGRTARNVDGKVIMYADKITDSMRKTIDETNRRRKLQEEYNKKMGIEPKTIYKSREEILASTSVADVRKKYNEPATSFTKIAEPIIKYMTKEQKKDLIEQMTEEMLQAAKDLEFEKAAYLRDEIEKLKKMVKR